jgi:hypothetical protein
MKRKDKAIPFGTTVLRPGVTRTVAEFDVPDIGRVGFLAYVFEAVSQPPVKGSMTLGGL